MTTPAADAGRAAQALELRKAGVAYVSIAERLGYPDAAAARAVVTPLLEAAVADDRREAGALELLRLDGMLTGLHAKARGGDTRSVEQSLRLLERKRLLQVALEYGGDDGEAGG